MFLINYDLPDDQSLFLFPSPTSASSFQRRRRRKWPPWSLFPDVLLQSGRSITAIGGPSAGLDCDNRSSDGSCRRRKIWRLVLRGWTIAVPKRWNYELLDWMRPLEEQQMSRLWRSTSKKKKEKNWTRCWAELPITNNNYQSVTDCCWPAREKKPPAAGPFPDYSARRARVAPRQRRRCPTDEDASGHRRYGPRMWDEGRDWYLKL